MNFADICEGEYYAVGSPKSTWRSPEKWKVFKLHVSGTLPQGYSIFRSWHRTGPVDRKVVCLTRDVDKSNPFNIRATTDVVPPSKILVLWSEYEKQKAIEQEATDRLQEMAEKERRDRQTRWNKLKPWLDQHRVTTYGNFNGSCVQVSLESLEKMAHEKSSQ